MQVTAEETYIDSFGERRGRICRREDGRFQVVTERLRAPTDEYEAYWINEHPASGVFARLDEARAHLMAILPEAAKLHNLEPCTFQLEVGPYPEPVQRTSA